MSYERVKWDAPIKAVFALESRHVRYMIFIKNTTSVSRSKQIRDLIDIEIEKYLESNPMPVIGGMNLFQTTPGRYI